MGLKFTLAFKSNIYYFCNSRVDKRLSYLYNAIKATLAPSSNCLMTNTYVKVRFDLKSKPVFLIRLITDSTYSIIL